jgi:hypothetical protein
VAAVITACACLVALGGCADQDADAVPPPAVTTLPGPPLYRALSADETIAGMSRAGIPGAGVLPAGGGTGTIAGDPTSVDPQTGLLSPAAPIRIVLDADLAPRLALQAGSAAPGVWGLPGDCTVRAFPAPNVYFDAPLTEEECATGRGPTVGRVARLADELAAAAWIGGEPNPHARTAP